MSDYYGSATLEDWLAEEVFEMPSVPANVVALFEQWREDIEYNIQSWMDSDDGEGRSSWRAWGRGFTPVENDKEFDEAVTAGRKLLTGVL